jgi:hypothetical protein
MGEGRKSLLFLKKKKQKDFYSVAPRTQAGSASPEAIKKSLFASFSSEKEESFLASRCPHE